MIVGITGAIGSGKDTVAKYLISKYGFIRMSYASTLKDAVAAIFHWDREMLEGHTEESRKQRETVDQWWANRLNIPHLTPRWVLQYFGTDVCRKAFHDDLWIASLENMLARTDGNVVISDCRFPNELKSLKSVGAITMRVERGPEPEWYPDAALVTANPGQDHESMLIRVQAIARLNQWGIHASEYSSVGLQYDHVIKNDGTLEELYSKVDSIINL